MIYNGIVVSLGREGEPRFDPGYYHEDSGEEECPDQLH